MEEGKEKGMERQQGKGNEVKGMEKLKRGGGMVLVGKRGGPSTPSPTWRLEFSSSPQDNSNPIREFLNTTTTVSARKLCANLWEIQPQLHPPSPAKTGKVSVGTRQARTSRVRNKDKNVSDRHTDSVEPPYTPPVHRAASASTSRRHAVPSVTQRHPLVEESSHLQPLSPESYDSSMEVATHNDAISPTSSLDFKGRKGESSYGLKTSTELLKVLNRIWGLEEQQASNMSLLKALQVELDHSRSQIKRLLKEKQTTRQEIDDLMRQIEEDKLIRNKDQDRIKAAAESLQEELGNERKLRKQSESLHRKLARELSEVKYAFSNALKELERERKARTLLESLCDEFAKGIREYEQEVRFRSLRHKPEVDHVGREKPDRLVLHISEAWLDERMQMKQAESQNGTGKSTIVDKLGLDIETFLQARHSVGHRKDISHCPRRESFPLNEAVSAPQDDEEDSFDGGSPCFELSKPINKSQLGDNALDSHQIMATSNSMRRVPGAGEDSIGKLATPQMKLEEDIIIDKTQIPDSSEVDLRGDNQATLLNSATTDIYQNNQGGLHQRRRKPVEKNVGFNSNHAVQHLIRNLSLSSEGEKIHPECGDLREDSVVIGPSSPVQQWMSKLKSPEFESSDSSLKLTKSLKETTLKAKLLEARLEAQKSRLRASQASL
ncbi:hypothetical protein Tsubulata_050168 [Turnera subulata]|uniref:Uncharacterized protein n=1 Tax=Turnera subulata TaxID=218843 RepID=A0A9Q0F9I7_9ROSI|nr:hypothetical protein Tsubulata_050168 [Turnera subulata]